MKKESMKRSIRKLVTGSMAFMALFVLSCLRAYAAPLVATCTIPVQQHFTVLSGSDAVPVGGDEITYVLKADVVGNPMPNATSTAAYSISSLSTDESEIKIKGDNISVTLPINFSSVGTYGYQLKVVSPVSSEYTLDSKVYHVVATIVNDPSGGLTGDFAVYVSGDPTLQKYPSAEFDNKYYKAIVVPAPTPAPATPHPSLSPTTGDRTNVIKYVVLLGGAVLVMGIAAYLHRKKHD
jgi:lipoprotein